MTIKLAFLSTGTCNSTPRNPSSLALSNGNEIVLIDCGGGCYHQISRLEDDHFRYDTISTILLTHFHPDHAAGLIDILWGEQWRSQGPRSKPITIVGPPGLDPFINTCIMSFIGNHPLSFKIRPIEISGGGLYRGSFFTAESFEVSHADITLGYLIHTEKISLAVTGDTGMCDNLVRLLAKSHMAIMEWSRSDHSGSGLHISNREVEQMIKLGVLPPRIYIVHMYPTDNISFNEQVRLKKDFLNKNSEHFFFPQDLTIITIE